MKRQKKSQWQKVFDTWKRIRPSLAKVLSPQEVREISWMFARRMLTVVKE